MNKQPEITDATRAALKSAFISLAKKKSIHQITVKEITDIAGYSRITFYRYFYNVYDVLESLEDDSINSIKNGISDYFATHDEIDSSFFSIFLNTFHDKREEFAIILYDENRISAVKRLQESLMDNFFINIEDTYHNRLILETYFNGVFSAIAMHLNNPNEMSDTELTRLLQNLFINWFLPEISNK